MQETRIQRIITCHSLYQCCIEGDLFLRLGDIDETHTCKTGDFLGRTGRIGVAEFRRQHLRVGGLAVAIAGT